MPSVIHVVDDDEGVCGSLQALLELRGYIVRSHLDAKDFLSDFKPSETLCVVADLRMPSMSGLELQEQLGKNNSDIPFIMITGHGDVPSAVQALKHGAMDFIEKPLKTSLVLAAVERAVETRLKSLAKLKYEIVAKHRLSELTPRELEVLNCIVSGKPNKIIAFELGISQRTIENHRAHLMLKMQVTSVAELVKFTIAGGLKVGAESASDQSITK
jgi:FixJ family two-component response regulator